ncbi:unnamed protein product [Bursaphelenchus xylophilus]|uniref:(pine wood nematode) hypothetical protein n=1 Tax=Bursaphelenchus xylophilus TaxID=6326 RepID=A0A1I7S9L0_BURXY|nr:unnamed protein product [Bursaphelenchus xylophilus]CAG9131947.1 unnamed protein product [Bursaphelenchus xylophilus]
MQTKVLSMGVYFLGLLVLLSLLTSSAASPVHAKRRHVNLMDRLGANYKAQPETSEKRRSIHQITNSDRLLPIKATFIKSASRAPATQNRAHVIGFGVQTSPFERYHQKNMRSAMKNILLRMN